MLTHRGLDILEIMSMNIFFTSYLCYFLNTQQHEILLKYHQYGKFVLVQLEITVKSFTDEGEEF